MPLFNFTDGSNVFTGAGSNLSIDFTDNSVPFTMSTSGNGGFNDITYNADFAPANGHISLTDSSINGVFTLDVNSSLGPNSNFGADGGNISLQIGSFLSGAWNVTFEHETNTALDVQFMNVSANQLISFATTQNFEQINFTPTGVGNFITISSLTASIVCYLEGTGIATPEGRVAVEDLRPGDQILTADGDTTTVNWLGIQPINTATATPAKVNPIRFVAGSLSPGVPARDLLVSPDHAMEIDGMLYNASVLVNGRSIYQVGQMPMSGFTYYHIDTGTHELILAEGAASETYVDYVGRDAFINGHEQADAAVIPEMAVPRISAGRMMPKHVGAALADRADALGLTAARKVA